MDFRFSAVAGYLRQMEYGGTLRAIGLQKPAAGQPISRQAKSLLGRSFWDFLHT